MSIHDSLVLLQERLDAGEIEMMTITELISTFPEYEPLITDALQWLDEREPIWDLDEPINREQFINDLVERAMIANRDY